ncbi:hypothetical protein VTK26DRAFT_8020 [Humicola hyalothermophila]
MDPLTALSVAAATAQFIDFGFKIVSNAREIYGSVSGATDENQSLAAAALEIRQLTERLVSSTFKNPTEEQEALNNLITECGSLSNQLLKLLDKARAKDPKSKFQSTIAALKSKHYEREKLNLYSRLQQCRLRLESLLSEFSRSATQEQLEHLIQYSSTNNYNLGTIRARVEEISRGVALESIGPKARAQFQELLGISESMYTKAAQRKVLGLIAFPGMRNRMDVVERAHSSTFKWIFDDGTDEGPDVENAERPRQRNREGVQPFVEWLSSGDGAYHISGKLGSGKSTLMKYLCGHARVREELQKWAGSTKLVIASFFFWRNGSPLQRSLPGLFRTLLHDVLEECPELIPSVLPELWEDISSSGCEAKDFQFGNDRVRSAFLQLLQRSELYESRKFCFFIDGLDEYKETLQDDYKAMVQLLFSWTEAIPHGVKLCVSSREYNVFVNFFSSNKRLRLQDLTLADMQFYIRDRLQDLEAEYLDRLERSITGKANGIFLWVALVVKAIRNRLEDGCSMSVIEEEIDSLPDELEALFQHLLNSISKVYRKGAYQTFAMLELQFESVLDDIVAICPSYILHLQAYSFLDCYNADPEFAHKEHPPFLDTGHEARRRREENARKRLTAQFQGLLEVLEGYGHIIYTHRSVADFLRKHLPEARASITPGFEPVQALSQLYLAEIRNCPRDSSWIHPRATPKISYHLQVIMLLRNSRCLDQPPFAYLESLGAAAKLAIPEELKYKPEDLHPPKRPINFDIYWRWQPASTLYAGLCCGLETYTDWKLGRDLTVTNEDGKVADLACFAVGLAIWVFVQGRELNVLFVLGQLLRRGVAPNAAIHFPPVLPGAVQPKLSLWEYSIFMFMNSIGIWALHFSGFVGKTIQDFLEYGSNTDLHVVLVEKPSPEKTSVCSDEDRLEHQIDQASLSEIQFRLRVAPQDYYQVMGKLSLIFYFRTKSEESKVALCGPCLFGRREDHGDEEIRFLLFIVSMGGRITFRDFIEHCKFPNEQAILTLLDQHEGPMAKPSIIEPAISEDEPPFESPPHSRADTECATREPRPNTRLERHLTPGTPPLASPNDKSA